MQEEEPDDVMVMRKTCWAELGAHFHDCWRWRRRVIQELLNIVLYIVRMVVEVIVAVIVVLLLLVLRLLFLLLLLRKNGSRSHRSSNSSITTIITQTTLTTTTIITGWRSFPGGFPELSRPGKLRETSGKTPLA